jgi:hypothetical protein
MITVSTKNGGKFGNKKLGTNNAIIHRGFIPRQNKRINQVAGFRRNNPADDSTTKS